VQQGGVERERKGEIGEHVELNIRMKLSRDMEVTSGPEKYNA